MAWPLTARQKSIESRRRTRSFSNQFIAGKIKHHPTEVKQKISRTMKNDEQRRIMATARMIKLQPYIDNYKENEMFTGFYSDGTESEDDFIL